MQAGFDKLDHMPAKLGLHGFGNSARLHRDDGFLEWGNHHAFAEPTQITAIGSGGSSRLFACEVGEIGAFLKLGDQCQSLIFGFDENMRCAVFAARFEIGKGLVVGSLNILFRDGLLNARHQRLTREQRTLVVFHLVFESCVRLIDLLAQGFLLHQTVNNPAEKNFRFELLILGGKRAARGDHGAKGDVLSVHGRHDGLGSCGGHRFGICVLRLHTAGQGKCSGHCGREKAFTEKHGIFPSCYAPIRAATLTVCIWPLTSL